MNAVLRSHRPPQFCQLLLSGGPKTSRIGKHKDKTTPTLHANIEEDRILVFYLIDIDCAVQPFTVVFLDVIFKT